MPAVTRPRPLLLWGLPIVLLWGAAWLALALRQTPPAAADAVAGIEGPTPNRDLRLGLFVTGSDGNEEPIGVVTLRQRPLDRFGRAGIEHLLDLELELMVLGRAADLELRATIWRPAVGDGTELSVDIDSAGSELRLTGVLSGGELRAQITSAGSARELVVPIQGDLLLSGGLAAVSLPDLEPGESARIATFDPITLGVTYATVRCLRRESPPGVDPPAPKARLLEVSGGLLDARAWIDEDGAILRAETPLGIVLRRLPDGAALADLADRTLSPDLSAGLTAAPDLLSRTAVEPRGQRPHRGAKGLLVRVLAPAGVDLPVDAHQGAEGGGRYRIRDRAHATDRLPAPADLAAEPLVQADDPRIQEQARAIVATTDGSGRAHAMAVHDWVYRNIAKEPALTVPSALEVLDQRRGDCNEHTVLFAALARAVGVPTRIAIGLVWSDDLDGFYYHAWPEVWVEPDGWLRRDPTLGQSPADATHIKLLEGGIERWPQLLAYLGRLELEVERVDSD
jgi:hypothetical protein